MTDRIKSNIIGEGFDNIIIGESYWGDLSIQMSNDESKFDLEQAELIQEAIGNVIKEMKKNENK